MTDPVGCRHHRHWDNHCHVGWQGRFQHMLMHALRQHHNCHGNHHHHHHHHHEAPSTQGGHHHAAHGHDNGGFLQKLGRAFGGWLNFQGTLASTVGAFIPGVGPIIAAAGGVLKTVGNFFRKLF